MTREILFRARWGGPGEWNFVTVTPQSDFTLLFGNHSALLQMYSNGGEFIEEWAVEVDQYTGCEDREGTKIFEGDIMELEAEVDYRGSDNWGDATWADPPRLPSQKDVVVLRPPLFWLSKECFGYEGEELRQPSTCKVIGNIHANPELLEDGE